ncbi:hypothetical protein EWM64_g3954 [Hericium alpestre]|uniref:HBS1-like protein N-terminal domain-containing protein n=1 Tax=Hericium alpestre TaxID=135208 RepID=A0A4Y9ZZ04_9AGAM|nr:hypothetical protein EWM64_g3954 [Hericium alpestre]
MDLADERDDGALSDGGEADMSPEERAQMNDALDKIRRILGSEQQSGFTDSFIEETLYDCYFDVDQSVEWLLEERARQGLPPLPEDDLGASGIAGARMHASMLGGAYGMVNGPLIVRAQQDADDFYEGSEGTGTGSGSMLQTRLSTISEHTEQTEESKRWSPGRGTFNSTNYRTTRSSRSMTSTSSYGNVIDSRLNRDEVGIPLDPNTIPVSPPHSALSALPSTIHEEQPSASSSGTRTPLPGPPSDPTPPLETVPEILETHSMSSAVSPGHNAIPVQVFRERPAASSPIRVLSPPSSLEDKPLPALPPPSEPRYSQAESLGPPPSQRKSKLSALASSRAASSRASTYTKSSRLSSSSVGGDSILTYPALRPSPASMLSLASAAPSGTSSIVRRAIQTAMDQEAGDTPPSDVRDEATVSSSSSSQSTVKASASAPPSQASETSTSIADPGEAPPAQARGPSKLALLAQAKTKQAPWSPKPKQPRSPSPHTLLNTSHTEYLTPIANGPTATTAITTSYQSLDRLISPARSALPPSFPPPDYSGASSASERSKSPTSPKRSKLAMKAKKSQAKRTQEPEEDVRAFLPVPTMFIPDANRSRASPSTFASLLVDGELLTHLEDKEHRHKKEKGDKPATEPKERRRSLSSSQSNGHSHNHHQHHHNHSVDDTSEKSKTREHKHVCKHAVPPPAPKPSNGAFAFDIPSPDDAVFNARKGTSLARSSASSTTIFPPSTASSRSSAASHSTVKA